MKLYTLLCLIILLTFVNCKSDANNFEKTNDEFYAAIVKQDYGSAYQLLDQKVKMDTPESEFIAFLSNLHSLCGDYKTKQLLIWESSTKLGKKYESFHYRYKVVYKNKTCLEDIYLHSNNGNETILQYDVTPVSNN